VVSVTARPVDGKATEAALRAVAEAFDVRRRDVALVSGAASRDKIVEIDGTTADVTSRRDALLDPARTDPARTDPARTDPARADPARGLVP
jgi:uncharacterized protein YggU (UPF0235/DUF167 family)